MDSPIYNSCLEKQEHVIRLFSTCSSTQQKYEMIIELRRKLQPYPANFKTDEYLVKGCQSEMYLHATLQNDKIQFLAYSEALISAGIASLLLAVYHDEPPEAVLSCPPTFLEKLGILSSLSPGRSNGLASLFHRMKQEALKLSVNLKF